jgi:hypothetical protein
MNTERTDLFQQIYCAVQGAVMLRIDITSRERDHFIRFDSRAFESHAARSLIVKLTDIQHAAIRQRVPVSNRKHAPARAATKHLRATFRLQRRREDLRGA